MFKTFVFIFIYLFIARTDVLAEVNDFEQKHVAWDIINKAEDLLNTSPDSAQLYIDSCYFLLSQNPSAKLLAKCNLVQSNLFYKYKQYNDAIKLVNSNIRYFKENNQPLNLARSLYLTGLCKYNTSDFRRSVLDLVSACAIYDSLGMEQEKIYAENVIGSCFFELGEHTSAKRYFNNVNRFATKNNDSTLLLLSLNNLALVSQNDNAQKDSSLIYLKRALKLAEALNYPNSVINIYINLADDYLKLGATKTASEHLLKANEMLKKHPNYSSEILVQLNFSEIYFKTQDYKSAIYYANKGLELSEKYNFSLYIDNLHLKKAASYKKLGDLENAYEQLEAAFLQRDSLWNEQLIKTASETNAKYNTKKNLKEIELKQVLIENQQEKLKQQKVKNIILSIGLGVILFLVFIVLRYSQKLNVINQSLKRKNQIINEKNITLKETIGTRDRLISIIAHDIKNPLGTIAGFSELITLLSEDESIKKSQKYAQQILNSSRNLYNLLENLLEWAKAQQNGITPSPSHLNVSTIIQANFDLMTEMAKQKQITLLNYCIPEHFIYSDENTTQTIIRNIVTNAIKFTNNKGEIKAWSKIENNKVCICIEDNGIGISEEDLPRVFDEHTDKSEIGQSTEKGIGMGLLLCKDFAKLNNGEIKIKSELGKGSCFTIKLPHSTQNFSQ